jgi:hypothetical protein
VSRPSRTELQEDFAGVRRVLMEVWNPLGAGGWPADEYDSYVWPIVRLLRGAASDEKLHAHLAEVERHYFGQDIAPDHAHAVITALRALSIESAGVRT